MIAEAVKYKSTGHTWLPEIPSHWDWKRLGGLFDERNETVSETDFPALSVTKNGVVPQLENAAKTMHIDNRKKVCMNDFAINSRSDRRGSGGVSEYEGSVSIVNTVLKPSNYYLPQYTHYLLTNRLFQDEFYAKGKGIVDDMWSTKFGEMKTIYLPVPPMEEQSAIVAHIEAQEVKIKCFIQKKRRFVELLKEQRQGVIDEAIAKGVNPKVKLVESGINWLGQIPSHWQVRKLKFCVELNSNEVDESEVDEDVFKIALENIDNWTGKLIDTGNPQFEGKGVPFKTNDVLFNKLRPYLAKSYIAKSSGYCVGELLVLSPIENLITSEFLFQRLMTSNFIDIVNSSTYGAKMPRANWGFIGNLKIALPPIDEQLQIIEHIKNETRTVDTTIAKAEREIELMQEYRHAMIAGAVIGKLI